jgi:hypothetical protein
MTEQLVACGACHRHVWSHETACPFCGAGTAGARVGSAELPFRRMAVAAVVAAGVAAAASTGCSSTSSVAFYGAPGMPGDDASQPSEGGGSSSGGSSTSSGGATDGPSVVAFYGNPFFDAG